MEVAHWSSGRTGGYFLNYFVMNAGKVARKLAEIALTKVVKVGENKLTMYNIILSAIVGAPIAEFGECTFYCLCLA